MTTLGVLDVLPSTLIQRCWVFLATELTHGPPERDTEEDMEPGWFTRDHVEQMIKNGSITDAKTGAAYTLLFLHEQSHSDQAPTGPRPAPHSVKHRQSER